MLIGLGPAEGADPASGARKSPVSTTAASARTARAYAFRVPRSRDRRNYPIRGIVPRTRGVARTRDGASGRTEYNEREGRGLPKKLRRPSLSRTGMGAQR